jgi:hypothetical protein
MSAREHTPHVAHAAKYYRKPKLVYKAFLSQIRKNEQVLCEEQITSVDRFGKTVPKGKVVAVVLFRDELDRIQMMLGLRDRNAEISEEESDEQAELPEDLSP